MKVSIKRTLLALMAVPTLAVGSGAVLVGTSVYAANECDGTGKVTGIKEGKNCAKTADQKGNLGNVIEDITNVLLFIIGAVAVIMIIVGGIKYVLSNGDSAQITSAKNTILYAVIGIVVALLAYAIVNFVVDSFTSSTDDEGGASRTAS